MRIPIAALVLAAAIPTYAATLTLTASHLTVEQGQPIPPLVWTQSSYPTTCTGFPSLSTTATGSSTPGTYTISLSAGTFACTGYTITYAGNNLVVIANDGIGAQITASVSYPPGFIRASADQSVLNVTSNAVADMVGDGSTDNTTAFNALLAVYGTCSGGPIDGPVRLYFPAGIYLVSGQINTCNTYGGFIFFGSGPQSSVIRLAPNSAAFNTGTNTVFINSPSISGNNNFFRFIYNMGIDIGYGNPNAIPLAPVTNNVGAIRNTIIWSEDGNCPYGIAFQANYPGPALLKEVAIYGCTTAIYSNQIEYSWTIDGLTTEGQTGTVFINGPFKMAIQHWLSDNTGTALTNAQYGGVSLLDSELLNGGAGNTGITNASGGVLFARGVTVTGYGTSEVDSGTGTPVNYTGNLTQNFTGTGSTLFGASPPSPAQYLPEQETPNPTDDPTLSNWTQLGTTVSGWCASIAGSASVTVYLPPGAYPGSGPYSCTVPDTVNHINFGDSTNETAIFQVVLTVAGSSSTPLVIDGCVFAPECSIVQTGTRTVVLRDSTMTSYKAGPGAGNLFLEDVPSSPTTVAPFIFVAGQNVWARQLDIEYSGGVNLGRTTPGFTCQTCNIWILGYKNEQNQLFSLVGGAKAEIFTQFIYPLVAAPVGAFIMQSTNSSLFVSSSFNYVNVSGFGNPYWIQNQEGTTVRTLATSSQNAGNYLLNAYYDYTTFTQAGASAAGAALTSGTKIQ